MRKSLTKSPPGAERKAPRDNQRRRTLRALIDSAQALRTEGVTPTLSDVAERAGVSRATAYRYFSSAEAALAAAVFSGGLPTIDKILAKHERAPEIAEAAAKSVNGMFLEDELSLHAMMKGFMTLWIDQHGEEPPPRPSRRFDLIDPVLDHVQPPLDRALRRRLRSALAMVIGTEAVITLRDVAEQSPEQTLDVSAWAARTLVEAAAREQTAKNRGLAAPSKPAAVKRLAKKSPAKKPAKKS